jgi:hypothetical protein
MIMQMPLNAVQHAVPASQLSVGTALVVFAQFFGGAIFLAFGQTAFINSLGPALEKFAPAVDTQFVVDTGATSLRDAVPAGELRGVLIAYNQALTHTFVSTYPSSFFVDILVIDYYQYLSAGVAVVAFVASFGMGFVNMKKGKKDEVEA